MKVLFNVLVVAVFAWVLSGCAGLGPADSKHPPTLMRKTYDKTGDLTGHVEVSVRGGGKGRVCQILHISKDGDVDYWQQQDGTSDWIIGRLAYALGPQLAGVVVAVVNFPGLARDLILGQQTTLPPPSKQHACPQPGFFAKLFGGGP